MSRDASAGGSIRGGLLAVTIGLFALLLALAGPARGAPGDLDTSFSGDGWLTTDLGATDAAYGVVVQPDGKVVVAGSSGTSGMAVARYSATGVLDPAFGTAGIARATFSGDAEARGLALLPDGRIVVAGRSGADMAVARFTAAGALDTTFSADGMQTIDIGGAPDHAMAVVLQGDGRIVVGGSSGSSTTQDFAIARLAADGSLDPSFSGDGKVTVDVTGYSDEVRALALQTDGRIVAAGTAGSIYWRDFGVARLTSVGVLDSTFAGDGTQVTTIGELDWANAVGVQSDGRILVAGTTDTSTAYDFAIVRYSSTGVPDTSFSTDGMQVTDLGGQDYAYGLALQPNGRVVLAGYTGTDAALARYDSSGSLDPTFSGDGKVTADFSGGVDRLQAVAMQPDQMFVVAGSSGNDFAVARIQGDDVTPPNTVITSGPSGVTDNATPTFAFSASEAGATFEYRIDSGAWSAANSPQTVAILADGVHRFEVRATDTAGNTDPSPASRVITVDTAAPNTTITSGPSGLINDTTPTFTFSATESSTFRCRLDTGPWLACESPVTLAVTDGLHAFEVRATDVLGHQDASPAVRSFTINTRAPDTAIDAGPPASTSAKTVTFSFSATDPAATFACRLDGGAFQPCISPKTVGPLAYGQHTFAVRAMDALGNVDRTPATWTFTVRHEPPVEVTATASRRQTLARAVTLTVTCSHNATVKATGRLTVKGKRYALKAVTRAVPARQSVRIKVKPSSKAAKAAKRVLKAHKKVTAKITVQATGPWPVVSTKVNVRVKR